MSKTNGTLEKLEALLDSNDMDAFWKFLENDGISKPDCIDRIKQSYSMSEKLRRSIVEKINHYVKLNWHQVNCIVKDSDAYLVFKVKENV